MRILRWSRVKPVLIYIAVSFLLSAAVRPPTSEPPGGGAGKAFDKVILGYFTSWKRESFDHTRIRYELLTHIVHAFTKPDSRGNLIVDNNYIYPELVESAHAEGVKILTGIGGWERSEGFPGMASTVENRSRFIQQVIEFCRNQGYDGVDLDWEFVADAEEKAHFISLAKELSEALNAEEPPLLLTMAAPSNHYWGRWIDFEVVSEFFDFIGIMTYDYNGEWSKVSGHNAPLHTCDGSGYGSIEDSVRYTIRRGLPIEKTLLGLAFFGHGFDTGELHLEFKEARDYTYREALPLLEQGWSYVWDDCAKVPYLKDPEGTKIVCFDDIRSMELKCGYVDDVGAAGVIIWELSNDIDEDELSLLSLIARKFSNGEVGE